MGHFCCTRASQLALLDDVDVLLRYLAVLPEARLDAAFARAEADRGGTLAHPPAETPRKDDFMKRIMELAAQLHAPVAEDAPPPAPLPAADVAFLSLARDFLAALARPATVESIRITHAYNRARLQRGTPRERLRSSHCFGQRLAAATRGWEIATLGVIAITLLLSVYTLIGRGLIQEVSATDGMFAALSRDLEEAEKADKAGTVTLAIGNGGPEVAAGVLRFCDRPPLVGEHRVFNSHQQERLCDRLDGYNIAFTQLFEGLQDWRTNLMGVAAVAPALLGGSAQAAAVPAAKVDPGLGTVQRLRLEVVRGQITLQAVADYVLPCLYAMLGALAAALRIMARKAEDVTLSYADGGLITRTVVLGVLFGSVIGLFSSQLGAAEGGSLASLTPAALSLLAGYSVAQVFQFFDGLSLRVFGPRPPAGTPTG